MAAEEDNVKPYRRFPPPVGSKWDRVIGIIIILLLVYLIFAD